MKNIEQFNVVAGYLLAKYYSRFPGKSTVDSRSYVEELKTQWPDFDWQIGESGVSVVSNTIDFLVAEGMLSIASQSSVHYVNVCLTMKGLNILNKVPDSIQSTKTYGEQLADAAKTIDGMKTIASIVQPVLSFFTT